MKHRLASDVMSHTLSDDAGLQLTVLDQGATWWSMQLPVPGEARSRELLLGGTTPEAHLGNTAYFGAIIGRYANRIAGASIQHQGKRWPLVAQAGSRHQLHGGPDGFDRRRWQVASSSARHLAMTLHSPDGDQGFPGAVDAEVSVTLPGGGVIELALRATTTAPTPLCLTNHAYFNLDGRTSDVRRHHLSVAATQMLPVDRELIPLGPLAGVEGTAFDFRTARPMAANPSAGGGVLDHAFLLNEALGPAGALHDAVTLASADQRVQLTIETTLPSVQVYSGEFLFREQGRDGHPLPAHAGVALEPQFLPDSPHHPEWPQPTCWLEPGQVWEHRIRYTLTTP